MSLKKRYQGSSSFNYRKEMFILPSPHLNKRYRYSVFPTNEELNNKIDLEIRILDGILKLLNAICNNTPTAIIAPPDPTAGGTSAAGTLHAASALSQGETCLAKFAAANLSLFDENKCWTTGAAIATAFMQQCHNPTMAAAAAAVTSSRQTPETSSSFDMVEMSQVFQILSACKCLFVSHRKIAIYLKNMQQGGQKKLPQRSATTTAAPVTRRVTDSPPPEALAANYLDLDAPSAVTAPKQAATHTAKQPTTSSSSDDVNSSSSTTGEDDCLASPSPHNSSDSAGNSCETSGSSAMLLSTSIDMMTKVVLSHVRLPLSWKWSDHLKATKNAENVTTKFATFALIYLGNMIYDTQLISNIDASVTEISFNETFVFDDVKLIDFAITIEVYSYELFNTTSNVLQSAKKLAKQLTDFATFKRYSHHHHNNHSAAHQQPLQMNQAQMLPSLGSHSSHSSHQYSMHKFKLIARGSLTHHDLSDSTQSKCLTLINEPGFENQPLNSGVSASSSTLSSATTTATSISNIHSAASVNKLPLFDYYSCRLRLLPAAAPEM